MNKRTIFRVLVISAVVAALAAMFASKHPDGLDRTSEVLGFSKNAASTPGVFTDYSVSFLHNPAFSTITAGIIGVIIMFCVFACVAFAIHLRNRPTKA